MTMPVPVLIETAPPLTGGCRTLHLPAKTDGPGLTLWINKPEADRPPHGWPTLILLDGEAYFTAAAEMAQRLARRPDKTRIAPLMIVGVTLDDSADRHAAFGFSTRSCRPNAPPRGQQLLRRLATDARSIIQTEGGDTEGLTLLGHSMSGLFALEARAAAAPFARFVAVGPSIWSNPSVIEAQPAESASPDDLLIFVGSEEETDSLSQAHLARRMISNARCLQAKTGAQLHVLSDEDHGSTAYAALPAALRFASRPSSIEPH